MLSVTKAGEAVLAGDQQDGGAGGARVHGGLHPQARGKEEGTENSHKSGSPKAPSGRAAGLNVPRAAASE